MKGNSVVSPGEVDNKVTCTPDCSQALNKDSFVAYPSGCTKYFQCLNGNAFIRQCSPGLHWNAISHLNPVNKPQLIQIQLTSEIPTSSLEPSASYLTEAPGSEAPGTEPTGEPGVDAPGTAEAIETPITNKPETHAPGIEAPETEAPETQIPRTEASGIDPITEVSGTEAPRTAAPATEAPVTEAPETKAPGSDAPATAVLTSTIDPRIDVSISTFSTSPWPPHQTNGYLEAPQISLSFVQSRFCPLETDMKPSVKFRDRENSSQYCGCENGSPQFRL
ncbi:unnamed protein product [Hermetia illucens]|uniref:Chitin-binding type-2 domain-containing protein n=1 Tax=Hermetia illucens TaxID=343691 RepID=A0A7R8UH92_HERIL|nr:unnamed protein product [Hermetia illucens]